MSLYVVAAVTVCAAYAVAYQIVTRYQAQRLADLKTISRLSARIVQLEALNQANTELDDCQRTTITALRAQQMVDHTALRNLLDNCIHAGNALALNLPDSHHDRCYWMRCIAAIEQQIGAK